MKAKYQNLLNAEKQPKKSYKTRGRTTDYLGDEGVAIATGVGAGVRSAGSYQRTPLPKTTLKPGLPAGRV